MVPKLIFFITHARLRVLFYRLLLCPVSLQGHPTDSVATCAARPGLRGSSGRSRQRSTRGVDSFRLAHTMLLLSVEVRTDVISITQTRAILL
jgi:hypothetical protein